MKKFSILFLILITFCSSGAENTEPQNTSNKEQSEELAQNEEFEVFTVDLGYDTVSYTHLTLPTKRIV